MYRGFRVAVVMPAFNEEAELSRAISQVPACVDRLIVVDDGSADDTARVAARRERQGLVVVRHATNRGVGAAIQTGYEAALAQGADIAVVMAGDGQMDGSDLPSLLDPICDGVADYVKGNRFAHRDLWSTMPKGRILGNLVLSLLTKLSSGYYTVFDSQCGYTAATRGAVLALRGFFRGYGYPNDVLARLRVAGARVHQVAIRPIYRSERSGIGLHTVLYPMLFVLLRSWGWRLFQQHLLPLTGRARREHVRLLEKKDAENAHRGADQLLPAPHR